MGLCSVLQRLCLSCAVTYKVTAITQQNKENMLTVITQDAIRLLRYINYRDAGRECSDEFSSFVLKNTSILLPKLEKGGLIRCVSKETPDSPVSYELCKPLGSINLLSLLQILGEGVCPVAPDVDEQRVYGRYGVVASRMGVVNQMMRSIFGEIHLTELCL